MRQLGRQSIKSAFDSTNERRYHTSASTGHLLYLNTGELSYENIPNRVDESSMLVSEPSIIERNYISANINESHLN